MPIQPADDDWQLAKLVGVSAARFEGVFDRAKPLPDNPAEQIAFGSLGNGNSASVEKIACAIAYARRENWLHPLMEQFVMGGEAGPDVDSLLAEVRRQNIAKDGSTLQAIADPNRGFVSAGLEIFHLPRIIRQVCRIDIDGKARGTGFLVHPEMVLTAYHVVRDLTVRDPEEPVQAATGSGKRIRVVFDDVDEMRYGFSARLPGFGVDVADEWLVHASPCHKLELADQFPEVYAELESKLDFALIRLNGIARVGIPPVTIGLQPVVPNDSIAIFQHRNGHSLAFDRAKVTALCGDWRFEHDVNAECGSSGSPCFDSAYAVVGLHQAGKRSAAGITARNRCVPLRPIQPAIEARLLTDPNSRVLPMSELTEGQPGQPVFGRLETQAWVWRQLDAEQRLSVDRPILAFRGLPGMGKSFTYDLLRSLLPRTHHDVVRLTAGEDIQQRTPEAFAALLLNRLEYPAMAELAFEANTERIRWLMATHLPALIRAIEAGRAAGGAAPAAPKGIWIVIDDIDTAAIGSETDISTYLFGLYATTRTRPWLRFVLLGFDGGFTDDLQALSSSYDLVLPSDEDLTNYLKAKLPPELYGGSELAIGGVLEAMRSSIEAMPGSKRLGAMQRTIAKVARRWAERR